MHDACHVRVAELHDAPNLELVSHGRDFGFMSGDLRF
jgi:hypothetical protein